MVAVLVGNSNLFLIANTFPHSLTPKLVGYGGDGVQIYGFILVKQTKGTLATHPRHLAKSW